MRSFSYSAPASLQEALPLLGPAARPLAGGTDLLTLMKADLTAPERLVGVRALLRGITYEPVKGLVLQRPRCWVLRLSPERPVIGHARVLLWYGAPCAG